MRTLTERELKVLQQIPELKERDTGATEGITQIRLADRLEGVAIMEPLQALIEHGLVDYCRTDKGALRGDAFGLTPQGKTELGYYIAKTKKATPEKVFDEKPNEREAAKAGG